MKIAIGLEVVFEACWWAERARADVESLKQTAIEGIVVMRRDVDRTYVLERAKVE